MGISVNYNSTHTLLLVFIGLYSVNGKVIHSAIYKRGNYYELVADERFLSIESMIAYYSRTRLMTEGNIPVKLTNQLIPDK